MRTWLVDVWNFSIYILIFFITIKRLIIALKHRTYVNFLQGSAFPLAKYSQFIVYVFRAHPAEK